MHVEQDASSPPARAERHPIRFYDSDAALARLVAEFLHEGFDRSNPGIVIATASLRAAIIHELTGRSFDVVELQRSRHLLLLDANEILSTFMIDGRPEERKFERQMYRRIQSVCRGRAECTVRMFGQIIDILWQDGRHHAAIQLEMLWNQLARTETLSLLSVYTMGPFYRNASVLTRGSRQEPAELLDGGVGAIRTRLKRHA